MSKAPVAFQSAQDVAELRQVFAEICRKNMESASLTMSASRVAAVSFLFIGCCRMYDCFCSPTSLLLLYYYNFALWLCPFFFVSQKVSSHLLFLFFVTTASY